MSNKVTHIVYSHHHADHIGASSLFGRDVVRVGQVENKRLLERDNDPARPVPDLTFDKHHLLLVGGERIRLAWQGTNHTPDNIYIHLPDHDTLMLVDIVLPGWVPFYDFNLNEDVPASIAAPAKALSYPWKHYIGGHMGRLGTRDDVVVYQQYVTDIADNVRTALATVDPTPYFTKYGNNSWAAVKTYFDALADYAAAPVIAKYTGVLAAADVFTASNAFIILESIRLDLGYGSQVHRPDQATHAGTSFGRQRRRRVGPRTGPRPRRVLRIGSMARAPGRVRRDATRQDRPWADPRALARHHLPGGKPESAAKTRTARLRRST